MKIRLENKRQEAGEEAVKGDKGHEQRQGFYVDIWEKKVSERKEKAIHQLWKAAWKNQCIRYLGLSSYSQVKKIINLASCYTAFPWQQQSSNTYVEAAKAVSVRYYWADPIGVSPMNPRTQPAILTVSSVLQRKGQMGVHDFSETQIKSWFYSDLEGRFPRAGSPSILDGTV